jgi:hypothetical protein
MYQHQGDSYLLSNIKINIYDSNMDLAMLKKNSVIFFQIIKNQQSTELSSQPKVSYAQPKVSYAQPISKNPMIK